MQLAASVITESKVEFGLARTPGLAPRVRDAMRVLLATVSVLPFEREDARVAAQLRASLNGEGTPIGAYDLLLAAACARRRGLKIVTHNARESGAAVPPSDPGSDPWHALVQVGAQFVAALMAANDPKAPTHPWIERDPATGERRLRMPLPPPETARQIADALSVFADGLRGGTT